MSTSFDFNAMPADLSEKGRHAWLIIHDYLVKHGLTSTNGCTTFFSPKEWAKRGAVDGLNAELIVVYDGSWVRECFDSHFKYDHEEAVAKALGEANLYPERITGSYSAIYAPRVEFRPSPA